MITLTRSRFVPRLHTLRFLPRPFHEDISSRPWDHRRRTARRKTFDLHPGASFPPDKINHSAAPNRRHRPVPPRPPCSNHPRPTTTDTHTDTHPRQCLPPRRPSPTSCPPSRPRPRTTPRTPSPRRRAPSRPAASAACAPSSSATRSTSSRCACRRPRRACTRGRSTSSRRASRGMG